MADMNYYTNHEIEKEKRRKSQDELKQFLEGFANLNIKAWSISMSSPKELRLELLNGLTYCNDETNGHINIHIEYEDWKEI